MDCPDRFDQQKYRPTTSFTSIRLARQLANVTCGQFLTASAKYLPAQKGSWYFRYYPPWRSSEFR